MAAVPVTSKASPARLRFSINVLLALGVGFILGGRRHHVMDYNPAGARAYSSMPMLAVVTRRCAAAGKSSEPGR